MAGWPARQRRHPGRLAGAAWSAQPTPGDAVTDAARVAAASAWLHGRAAMQALPEAHGPVLADTLIAAMAGQLAPAA
jgi:hypothetical protein